MNALISSVRNLTVSIEGADIVLEQEGVDTDVQFTCNRISLTVEQVPLVIEQLLQAAAEIKREREANNAHA